MLRKILSNAISALDATIPRFIVEEVAVNVDEGKYVFVGRKNDIEENQYYDKIIKISYLNIFGTPSFCKVIT